MVVKKSPQANLETKKSLYVMMGFVMVLSLVFIVFEWSKKDIHNWAENMPIPDFADDYVIPPTNVQPPPPPPPPKPVDEFKIVEKPVTTDNSFIKPEDLPTEGVSKPEDIKYDIPPEVVDEIHIYVEEMPEFKGDVTTYLAKNLKYPVMAQEIGIQGRVICQFVVNKDGSIGDVQVVRSADKSLDNEAVRVIKSMPNWKPGKLNGKAVRVKYTLPVNFKLM
ncbi:MAG: energy transducer TonB [Bacteroidales bacterium]|nr:energy transducer TonB [Bacteroidales bacterium]